MSALTYSIILWIIGETNLKKIHYIMYLWNFYSIVIFLKNICWEKKQILEIVVHQIKIKNYNNDVPSFSSMTKKSNISFFLHKTPYRQH